MCTQILICQLIKRKSFCVNEKEKQWVRSVVARLLVGRDQGMAADFESPKGNESVIFHLIWDHFPSQDLQGVIVSPHMKSLTLYKQFKLIILARGLTIRWCSWSGYYCHLWRRGSVLLWLCPNSFYDFVPISVWPSGFYWRTGVCTDKQWTEVLKNLWKPEGGIYKPNADQFPQEGEGSYTRFLMFPNRKTREDDSSDEL